MDVADGFIEKVLDTLPPEELDKLNTMIDNDEVTEQKVDNLLLEYNIDKTAIVKEIQGETQNESGD